MSRTVSSLILVVLLVVGTAAGVSAETRTFDAKKIKWTVPDGFTLEDPPSDQKAQGYLALALSEEAGAQCYLLARPADGLPIHDFQSEVLGQLKNGVFGGHTRGSKIEQGTLSGIDGFVVRVAGEIQDTPCYGSAWGIAKHGNFYVLIVLAYHGAQERSWKAIDEVKRGVRLTEGAGGDETPATGPWPKLAGSEASPEAGGTEFEWPEAGPKRDGNVITFPSHNLKWTLPADTPYEVTGVINDETKIDMLFLLVEAVVKGEGDEDGATSTVALIIMKREPGFTPDVQLHDMGFQSYVAEGLAERLPGGVTLDADFKLAGMDAAHIELKGKNEEGLYKTVSRYTGAHTQTVYEVRVETVGQRGCEAQFEPEIRKLLDGLALIDPAEPVPGPIGAGVPPDYAARGKYADEEREIKAERVSFEKPVGYAKLTGLAEGLKFAIERRSEDGQAYFYLDLQVMEVAALTQRQISLESLVSDRAAVWLDQAGESALTSKKGKGDPWFKSRFKNAKGFGWRFEGDLRGHPFVELGFVVTHKQDVYVIRAQFGGKDAEATLKKEWKAIQKAWDFNK